MPITGAGNVPGQRDIAKTSGAVSVATSSTVVAANNPSRVFVTLVNDGANVIYLALATAKDGTDTPVAPTAVANAGIRIAATGGSVTLTGYTGPIAGIALTGATVLTVVEV